jgi:hypothetical protein
MRGTRDVAMNGTRDIAMNGTRDVAMNGTPVDDAGHCGDPFSGDAADSAAKQSRGCGEHHERGAQSQGNGGDAAQAWNDAPPCCGQAWWRECRAQACRVIALGRAHQGAEDRAETLCVQRSECARVGREKAFEASGQFKLRSLLRSETG